MREILFRGRRKDNGKWVEGIAFPHDNHGAVTIFRQHPADGSLIGDEVIPESVGQYIGLTDKNGNKIFDGDIIELKYNYNTGLVSRIFKVIYCGYAFAIKSKKGIPFALTKLYLERGEVIGNIYDNPELLEANNE